MAFKVLVMSPLHQSGASAVSALMAQALTYSSKQVTLAYTDATSLLPKYLGIKNQNDPTRSIMQVAKLIQCGALEDRSIIDYTVEYSKNVHLMSFGDLAIDEKTTANIIKHVYGRVPTDICVVDGSYDLGTPVADSLIEMSDMVFIVVSPSRKDYVRMKYWLDSTQLAKHSDVFVIVNHYDEIISSVRDIAKTLGMAASRVCKVHENPWIRKMSLTGQLETIIPKVKAYDPRVANLSCDFNEISQCVISTMLLTGKHSQEDLF